MCIAECLKICSGTLSLQARKHILHFVPFSKNKVNLKFLKRTSHISHCSLCFEDVLCASLCKRMKDDVVKRPEALQC